MDAKKDLNRCRIIVYYSMLASIAIHALFLQDSIAYVYNVFNELTFAFIAFVLTAIVTLSTMVTLFIIIGMPSLYFIHFVWYKGDIPTPEYRRYEMDESLDRFKSWVKTKISRDKRK